MADPNSRKGSRYDDPELRAFVDGLHAPHDAALERAFRSPEAHGLPPIQVSAAEGKLLGLLLRLASARKVIEVGTLAGYSAIRMARALPEGGVLHTIELDPHHAEVARSNFEAAGVADKIRLHLGSGRELLPTLVPHGPFDAMFLDADKEGYPEYVAWAAKNLRPGGLLLADNSYFFGHLMSDHPSAAAMRRFHELAAEDFDSVCAPTPDGLVVGIKR
jgi:caffeoyl-CoA O-methyltransferase